MHTDPVIGIDLDSKPQLVRLLRPGGKRLTRVVRARLIDQRLRQPGRSVSPDDLLASGWPDERILPEPAAVRLRKAMSRLRKAGLGAIVAKRAEGWLLDESVSVIRSD